jgi:TRAP-type mannitol/chloroaromatic compound transport system substrate-binding protein
MRRRDFVHEAMTAITAVGAAAALGCSKKQEAVGKESTGTVAQASAAPAAVGQNVNWRLVSSFPRSLDTIFGAAESLAEHVSALSGGKFKISVFAAGEIVPGLEVLDAVQQGSTELAHTAGYYFTGKNPALAFDTVVPFGLNARQHLAWVNEGGGLELLRALYADFKVINFPGGNTGAQMGGWFRKEVNSAADLKGLRMRIPGLGGQVMSRLGTTVQVLAGGDIYPALERGAIDATEWVGPYDDEKLGFHKVAKLYYYPGWWEPCAALSFLVNQDAWAKLPKEYQQIFELSASQAGVKMQNRYDQRNPLALSRLLRQGVKLTRFSDDILRAARTASDALYAELSAQDANYKKVFEAYDKARHDMFPWFGTAERAYADFAFQPPV